MKKITGEAEYRIAKNYKAGSGYEIIVNWNTGVVVKSNDPNWLVGKQYSGWHPTAFEKVEDSALITELRVGQV
jgi:hypothetical protein